MTGAPGAPEDLHSESAQSTDSNQELRSPAVPAIRFPIKGRVVCSIRPRHRQTVCWYSCLAGFEASASSAGRIGDIGFGYVEAQTRLIPMKIEVCFGDYCGSDAEAGVHQSAAKSTGASQNTWRYRWGYKVKEGQVRWRKARPVVGAGVAMGAVSGELMPENRSLGRSDVF